MDPCDRPEVAGVKSGTEVSRLPVLGACIALAYNSRFGFVSLTLQGGFYTDILLENLSLCGLIEREPKEKEQGPRECGRVGA